LYLPCTIRGSFRGGIETCWIVSGYLLADYSAYCWKIDKILTRQLYGEGLF